LRRSVIPRSAALPEAEVVTPKIKGEERATNLDDPVRPVNDAIDISEAISAGADKATYSAREERFGGEQS
jgi:hypothetical protein